MNQRNLVLGLILIGLGAYLGFVELTNGTGGEAIVALVGIAFLIGYAVTRRYGFLVPGAIMTGLGVGILWETQVGDAGGTVVIGLGVGFLAIYVIDAIVRRSQALWWPLIPGGILTVVGVATEIGNTKLLDDLEALWPIVLIAIGVVLVFAQLRTRHQEPPVPTSHPETPQP